MQDDSLVAEGLGNSETRSEVVRVGILQAFGEAVLSTDESRRSTTTKREI